MHTDPTLKVGYSSVENSLLPFTRNFLKKVAFFFIAQRDKLSRLNPRCRRSLEYSVRGQRLRVQFKEQRLRVQFKEQNLRDQKVELAHT
jgi:hypothetical protein